MAPATRRAEVVLGLVLVAAVGVNGGNVSCSVTRSAIWTCSQNAQQSLSWNPPQRWYTLGDRGTAAPEVYASTFIQTEGYCCKHCVWDLGYPLMDPIILASDRTSSMYGNHMDCTQFGPDFNALDTDNNNKLSKTELAVWLGTGINKFLTAQDRLSHDTVFQSTDFDRDGTVSKEEWYVLRHFWAPIAVSRNGPLPEDSNTKMKDGVLGGLYWDDGVIEVFMIDVVNILFEQVSKSRQWWCTGSSPCYWDSSYVREFNDREKNRIMRSLDLDGSQRVSIEEHYFRHFADRNGDGTLDKAEYALSLYAQSASAFDTHDLNKDGEVTFLERKFVLADRSPTDGALDLAEWIAADLPARFGPFHGHKLGETVTVDGFRWYTVLHACALEGVKVYQVALSDFPWAPACNIQVYIQPQEPWVRDTSASSAAVSTTGSSRRQRTPAKGSNYVLDLFDEAVLRLKWNVSHVYLPPKTAGQQHLVSNLGMPDQIGSAWGTINIGLYSDWQRLPNNDYACTRSFAPSLDGFTVVVRSQHEEISLTQSVLVMIYQPAFINFACFLFIVLVAVGHVYWFLERKDNSEQFNPDYAPGIVDSVWFCIVTMTSVGYGDKVPVTAVGKAITTFWMLFGIINFGIFTGQITSEINLESAESAIADVDMLGGFKVGIYNQMAALKLDQQYQFRPVTCTDMADCSAKLLNKEVSALLVPKADVLTHFVKNSLASTTCGNPFRITGPPVLTAEYPAVRMCAYSKSVYASVYLKDALNQQLQILEQNGFAEGLRELLNEQVTDSSSASECQPASPYDWNVIIPAICTMCVYYAVIVYINHRKRVAQGRAIRSFFGQTQKTPEQLALYYGLKWKANARRMADARERGKEPLLHHYKPALSHDDRLLNFLKRVRVLASGHTHDLQRCQKDVDAVCHAINTANDAMYVTLAVLLAMVGALSYSIWAVVNVQPRYMRLDGSK
jgi:voltage-gated potassium channel Kch